jgi:cold shock protein
MATGTVKWFDSKKGFGFIVNEDGQDVFAHFSVIVGEGFRALQEGEVVNYEPAVGAKGLSASKIVRETAKRNAQAARASSNTSVPAA